MLLWLLCEFLTRIIRKSYFMKIRKRVKTSNIIAFSEIFFIGLTITTTLFYYFYSKGSLVNAELNRIENNSAQFSQV